MRWEPEKLGALPKSQKEKSKRGGQVGGRGRQGERKEEEKKRAAGLIYCSTAIRSSLAPRSGSEGGMRRTEMEDKHCPSLPATLATNSQLIYLQHPSSSLLSSFLLYSASSTLWLPPFTPSPTFILFSFLYINNINIRQFQICSSYYKCSMSLFPSSGVQTAKGGLTYCYCLLFTQPPCKYIHTNS